MEEDIDMAKPDIWMPLYIGDYLADTMHLTTEQHGAYLLLIMAYWKNGGALSSNDSRLAATCRLSIDAWSMHKHTLASFFDTWSDPELWILVRAEKEMEKAGNNQEKRTLRAQKAAAARWGIDATSNAPSIQQAMLNECPSPSPSYKDQKTLKAPLSPKAKKTSDPSWFDQFWKLYPNKVGKPKAKTSFENRCKTQADFKAIMDGLAKHVVSELFMKDEGRFQPHPTTWLNQDRYNDEVKPYVQGTNGSRSGPARLSLVDQVRQRNQEREAERTRAAGPGFAQDVELSAAVLEGDRDGREWEGIFARINEPDGKIVGADDRDLRAQVDQYSRD
jgi:uncharacterized protein YdaU (DUF1376 family)